MRKPNGNEGGQDWSGGYAPSRRPRWGVVALIVLAHLLAGVGLVRAFAPDLPGQVYAAAESLVTVTITAPPEDPADPPPAEVEPEPDVGAAGETGQDAKPREVAAPKPRVTTTPRPPAPPAASTGEENASGVGDTGDGSGAGGTGDGPGSGGSGNGQGNGARKLELVEGTINSARDYPIPEGGREARIGREVIVAVTVDTEGLPRSCRIYRSSGLPETDKVTCDLAMARFRFAPQLDANGNPVVATFYWQQRFFE